ncbi:MAG: response regulator [Bdellovibrionota bacterium]
MPHKFKTVLIVEDDHDVRVTLRQVYEAAGFYVFTVTNGHSAMELLNIIPAPKLILCDLRMPLMDGITFIKNKSSDKSLKDVPLIIMSAFHEHFPDFPGITCLPKPLDLFQLIKHSEDSIKKENLISKR